MFILGIIVFLILLRLDWRGLSDLVVLAGIWIGIIAFAVWLAQGCR